MFKLQEKPSALKREHQAFQKIKFFLCWTFFALLDLDPDIEFRSGYGSRDPIGYGSRDPIESRVGIKKPTQKNPPKKTQKNPPKKTH